MIPDDGAKIIIGLCDAGLSYKAFGADGCDCGSIEVGGTHVSVHCQRSTCTNCESVGHSGKAIHIYSYYIDRLSVAMASQVSSAFLAARIPDINDQEDLEWFLEWWRVAFCDRDGAGRCE